jgi:hypothetical protein
MCAWLADLGRSARGTAPCRCSYAACPNLAFGCLYVNCLNSICCCDMGICCVMFCGATVIIAIAVAIDVAVLVVAIGISATLFVP